MIRCPWLCVLFATLVAPAVRGGPTPGPGGPATVRGRLVDEAERPVADVELGVSLHADGQRLHATNVVTDALGAYELHLPSTPADGSVVWIRVAVERAGYAPRAVFRRLYPGEPRMPDLVLARGFTSHLRLVAEGRAVGGGSIYVFDRERPATGPHGAVEWRPADGRPDLTWDPVESRYHLVSSFPATAFVFARLERMGSAFARVELGPEHEGAEATAELRGGRELSGSLHDPEGRPLADVALVAHPAGWTSSFDPSRTVREIAEGGLCVAKARTDADGQFRFRALQDGDYTIEVVDSSYATYQGPQLPHGSWRAGARDVDLRLGAHRLVIEVRDERGDPVRSGEPLCAFAPGARPRLREPSVREAGPGEWTVEVHPGQPYTYGWFAEDRRPVEGTVTIEEGTFVTRRTLELAPRVEPTELRIAVRGERGEELPMAFWSVGLELRSVATGQMLDEGRVWRDLARQTLRVPPGRYELAATPGYGYRYCGEDPTPPIGYGAVVEPITVPAHGPFDVELRLWEGGRVHLFLELPEDVRDPRLVAPPGLSPCDATLHRNALLLDDDGPCTTVTWSDTSKSWPVFFYLNSDDLSHSAWSDRVVPGNDAISFTLLPPGRQELRIETPGFRARTVCVDVERGGTTDLRVRLSY